MTVGERLRECRFRQGLSQEKVAELLGSQPTGCDQNGKVERACLV